MSRASDISGGLALVLGVCLLLGACGGQSSQSTASRSAGGAESTVGKAGSTARFAIAGNTLYTIAGASLKLFDVSDATAPRSGLLVRVAEDIETLFPVGDYLFIGSQTGMHIYDNKLAGFPSYVSSLAHVRSCDPVIVAGDYAYLTLRGGSACGGFSNQLEVIDISDIQNPALLAQFPMAAPRGLGMLNDKLYVCDPPGLSTFAAANAPNITLIDVRLDISCEDVIPNGDVLITTGPGAVSQFQRAEAGLTLLSTINASDTEPAQADASVRGRL